MRRLLECLKWVARILLPGKKPPAGVAILLCLLLSGCGAQYRVLLTKTDGTTLEATAVSFTSSDAISLNMQRDEKGEVKSLIFSKTNTQPLSQVGGEVLQTLIGKIPVAGAVK